MSWILEFFEWAIAIVLVSLFIAAFFYTGDGDNKN